MQNSVEPQTHSLHVLTRTALMTALTCVLAPLSIPLAGTVPISLANFSILLSLYVLGWKLGTVSTLVYILIGAVGLPVFSNFGGGIGKLLGPTGGYIVGFIPMAILAGLFIDRYKKRFMQLLGMIFGTAVLYLLGTAWFCYVNGATVSAALAACVIPFIPVDLLKMAVVMLIGPMIRKALQNAKLM